MLRLLVEFLGADYEQWRALTRASLKLDLRTASLGQSAYRRADKGGASHRPLIMVLFIYVVMGVFVGTLVWAMKDVFLSGTIFLSYTMVMTAFLVLIDFSAVVISPDDFAILGYHPVSSRTYFISRLTNVLVYSTFLTLALGLVPILAFFFTLGFRPLLGLAALAATLLSGAAVALALVLVYTGILRFVHPNRLRRAVGYIQLLLSFFIYGGYMILPRMVSLRTMSAMTLGKPVWLLLHPATWFASYLDLAAGRRGVTEIVPAILSLAALALLVNLTRGKLALEYSDRLSSAAALSAGSPKASAATTRPAFIFRGREARAVALLIRNQFRYDQKFRLAVLGILPLTVFYLYMGLREGSLPDPLVGRGSGFGQSWLLYFAVLMFPTMLKTTLTYSDSYQASWIYFATPADRGRLVLWSKNFILAYFVLPYLGFIGAIFLYFFRNPWHVLLLLIVLGLLSHLFLQLAVFVNPALPFSQPPRKGQRSSSMIVMLAFGPIAAIGLLFVLSRWVYSNISLLMAVLAVLAALSWRLERALQKWVRRRTDALQYQE
jgi:hypothetical protein